MEKGEGDSTIKLTDGTVISLPEDIIWKIADKKEGYLTQPDGRRILSKGWCNTIGFQFMVAKSAGEITEGERWSAGIQFSRGYYFNQKTRIGVGAGLDRHEKTFVPIFAEFGGFLIKNKYTAKDYNGTAFLPFTYNLQMGYGFALHKKTEFEDITGGWMLYPSVGFMLGSRRGASFKLDVGYKFQHYQRDYNYDIWSGYTVKDEVLLRSFTVRTSWVF